MMQRRATQGYSVRVVDIPSHLDEIPIKSVKNWDAAAVSYAIGSASKVGTQMGSS